MTLWNIPTLEFSIRHALDGDSWQAGIYNEEFVQRLKLLFGHPDYFTTSAFGVVAPANPTAATAGSAYPLVVSRNSTPQALTVDVNPGLAVTKSGLWILLSDYVRQVNLADTSPWVPNVVYLAYSLQSAPLQQNDFEEWVTPIEARIGDNPSISGIPDLLTPESVQVRVATVETYVAFPDNVKEDFVPLAIVTVQVIIDPSTGATSTSLSIDHTRDSYVWNRPWFSAVDIEHRSMLGSGVQSNNNIHAIGEDEVTAGGLTPSQLALDHGMIVGRSKSFEKIPGYRCTSSVPTLQLKTDNANGTATGYPSKKYAELPAYPVRLGKVWDEDTASELGALPVPNTNLVVFPSEIPASQTGVSFYYTRVQACEPPIGTNEVAFITSNPLEEEVIIAGGLSHQLLANVQEPFSDAYKFPMRYELYVDKSGNLRKTPQVVYCWKRLEGWTQDTPEITQFGPAKLVVGLADASGSVAPAMSVKIHLYGKNAAGASIDEVFTFTGATWTTFTIPSLTIPVGALQAATQLFDSIDNVVIDERLNDGPNSAIIIWAAHNPFDTYDNLNDACHVAEVMWDGFRMANIFDKRIIETTRRDHLAGDIGKLEMRALTNLLVGGCQTVYVEDFRRPEYHILEDSATNFASTDPITSVLPHYNFNKLQVGLEGTYCTRALPVNAGSGLVWRVGFVPQVLATGTNRFVTPTNWFRYKLAGTGWSSWSGLGPVAGIPSLFEYAIKAPSPIPVAVQLKVYPFSHIGFVLFG